MKKINVTIEQMGHGFVVTAKIAAKKQKTDKGEESEGYETGISGLRFFLMGTPSSSDGDLKTVEMKFAFSTPEEMLAALAEIYSPGFWQEAA